jgi:lipopolysaccharide export system protein LptA
MLFHIISKTSPMILRLIPGIPSLRLLAILLGTSLAFSTSVSLAENIPSGSALKNMKNAHNSKEPISIDAQQLSLDTEARTFQYKGSVKVVQGDLTLLADQMDGAYTEDNQITSIIAVGNVDITKGPEIKATSDRAVYDAQAKIVTLTENPQLTQKGSTLSADTVKVFLLENRSTAEGTVKVKINNPEDGAAGLDSLGGR